MATTQAKRKVKHAGSRPNHPAASKQRIFAGAQPSSAPTPLTPAAKLKVVDPAGGKPIPSDALRRLEVLENRMAELTDAHARALLRIHQLESHLSSASEAFSHLLSAREVFASVGNEPSPADDEPAAEPSVDASAEDLGGESA